MMRRKSFFVQAQKMDSKLQEIVRNGNFESMTRREAASIEYPPVIQTSRTTLLSQRPKKPSDILSLTRIPSESTCQHMKELCLKGNYVAVDCDIGAFTLDSIELLLKIHSLRNVKHAVLKEQQWLKKEINLPDSACSYSKEHLVCYAEKIFNTPNHHSPLPSNRCILASDLATIAGTGWLNFCVITGITEILNRDSEETAALILNNMVLVDEQDLPEYVNCNIRGGVKYVVLFANVGKNKRNEVFISKPGHPGNHWTLLYVDLTVNKWYYIDTFCWGMPENLKNAVSPFVSAIYQQGGMALKPVSGIVPAHIESFGLSHSCSKACLKNIPVQTCGNICGVAAAVLAGIACATPCLWRNVFLNRNTEMPNILKWLLKPTVHSDFLRCSIISWLLTDSIDLSTLGITREQVKPRLRDHDFPSRRRFLGKVSILDDGHADENEENVKDNKGESPSGDSSSKDDASRMQDRSEGWITVQYGKKRKKVDKQGRQRKSNNNSSREASSAKKNSHVNSRGNNNSPRWKRNDRRSVDNSHGLKKEKREWKKADDEDKIPYDATISDDECADFYQHNTVRIDSKGNSKSNVQENNGVPHSERSTNPEGEARSMKKCDDDRIKVQRSREVKNVNTQRRQGHHENKNTTDVIAEPRQPGQNVSVKCKNNGSPGIENDRSSDDAGNGLKQENVGIEMAAGEDNIHKKKDGSSEDDANGSKKENIGCEMADGEDMIGNHSEDRKLKQEDKGPFRKEIDGMSKHMQNAPLQRMNDPVWENKGDTKGVVKEEERIDAENSGNDEETLPTGDALCYSTKTIIDGMLKDGNQKVLQETVDEMAMTENTVGDQKFEDDKEKCCRLSANVVSPGDVEGVPIQEKREKDEKSVDDIYLDDYHESRECVNDGYGPQCSGGMPVDGTESNGEDDERNVVMKSDVFFVGQKFHTLEELETAKRVYEDSNFCELWKRDVRTLIAAEKRVPKRVSNANPDLMYYSLHLSCKFGGRNVETRVNRKRKTKSFRQGCPFEVHITLSEDGKYLQVNRISTTHNHVLQKQIYERLPRQRAARTKEVTRDIEDAIKLQANPKLLKEKIETSTGKKVTLKDISNIKQNSKRNIQKNDLEDVIGYLKKQPGCCTDVVVDEENNFKSLFYQDAHMQNIYTHFPEILLVDATYKLLDLRMPVYLLMGIDGDGLSEVVAMFIVAEETKEVIQATVELFKKHNPSWDETKVVMSDKDFTERDVFKSCFPAASLSICLYHTLRSFRREITCEKMGITSAERLRALEILSSLAHSKTAGEYEKHLDELKQTNFRSVIDYVLENWHPIREQWVACFKDKHLNLGETTNNRLESTFSKFKSVCSRYASLLQFCTEFMSVLRCLREERNHHYVMAITRRQTEFEHLCKDLQEYSKTLTPYAFKFVCGQYESVPKVKVLSQKSSSEFILCGSRKKNQEPLLASPSHCECSFFTRMSLPCKHILKVRELLTLPAFDETLLHKRWTMDFYLTTNRLSPALPVVHDHDLEHCVEYVPVIEENITILTQSQKFKKGLKISQVLASLVSEGGMSTFKRRHEVLESLVRSWKLGREVIVQELGRAETEADLEAEDPSETHHENYISVEQVKEEKPTGNTDERELEADDEPVNEVSSQNENKEEILKEDSVVTYGDERKGIKSPDFSQIKMPPKILKRGRPKGAEVTVIGLPKKKKKTESQNKLLSFKKLSPMEKDRMILGSLSTSQAVGEAIAGHRLLNKEDILPVGKMSDTIRDDEMVDIHRVEKYFDRDAWLLVLKSSSEKNCIDFVCSVCTKMINDEREDSIACDRCLLWSHFKCTSLKKRPKHRNWFCTSCRVKYA